MVLLKIKSAGLLRHVDRLTATDIPNSSMSFNFEVNFFLVYDLSKRRYLLVDRGFEFSKKNNIFYKSVKYFKESIRTH